MSRLIKRQRASLRCPLPRGAIPCSRVRAHDFPPPPRPPPPPGGWRIRARYYRDFLACFWISDSSSSSLLTCSTRSGEQQT
eukprot:5757906-Pyramimonas_sp.AAC.1